MSDLTGYYCELEISLLKNQPDKSHLKTILRNCTNLTPEFIEQKVRDLFTGEVVQIVPVEHTNAIKFFESVHQLRQLGLKVNTFIQASTLELPYLVDDNGLIDGTERETVKILQKDDLDFMEAVIDSRILVVTEYGQPIYWISENRNWEFVGRYKGQIGGAWALWITENNRKYLIVECDCYVGFET